MMQPATTPSATLPRNRRRAPRHSVAFNFWYRRHGWQPRGGLMIELARGGGAFLAEADFVPRVGDSLELHPMRTGSRLVRAASPALPARGRVVRVENSEEPTRRVAIRFEEPLAMETARVAGTFAAV